MPIKAPGLLPDFYKARARDILSERFILPPFTVLNTREGFWQTRKRQWIAFGIKSELGRGYTEEGTAYGSSLGKSGALNQKYRDASPGGSPRIAMPQAGRKWMDPLVRGDGRGRPLVKSSNTALKPAITLGAGISRANSLRYISKELAGKKVAPGGSPQPAALSYQLKAGLADGKKIIRGDGGSGQAPVGEDEEPIGGTSIFDPVLCELAYRWFCPRGGSVIDPFAGGSVRGIIAGELGLQYVGMDLSAIQVEANKKQAVELGTAPEPIWICGDSATIQKAVLDEVGQSGEMFDFLFTCPPYGDLEVYSQDPRDISNMSLADFNKKYAEIIAETAQLLVPGSFACVVVGDYRDKDGYYCNLPQVTIAAFEAIGMRLYNEAILVNVTGSLPLRINNQFNGSRKLGKCHQNVLVFAKGQPKDFVKLWPAMEINK